MNYEAFLKAKKEGKIPKPLKRISFNKFMERAKEGISVWFTYNETTFLLNYSPNIRGYIIDEEEIDNKLYIRKKEEKLSKRHFMPSLEYCIEHFQIDGKNFKYIIEHATDICFRLYL